MRLVAINKFNAFDQETLIKVAFNDKNWIIRGKAVKQIIDETVLFDIAMLQNDNDLVNLLAVSRITDNELLCEIVLKSNNEIVEQYAISKI